MFTVTFRPDQMTHFGNREKTKQMCFAALIVFLPNVIVVCFLCSNNVVGSRNAMCQKETGKLNSFSKMP